MALVLAVVGSTLSAVNTTQSAEAAVASQFNPGLIISDALFFDGGAMTPDAVQNFLNSQVRTCSAGFVCLRDYRQDTVTKAANGSLCSAYSGAANESAATIIAKVGVACGISQKAMLVLLQKEQGLITSTAPSAGKYRAATGYGCPDTAACDSTYYGFFNQVYMAALQFKRYAATPTRWNHVAGRVNSVRIHPTAACGTSSVLIQNQATAGLYNYTPYTPNNAALNNLYGTGDACSSYGNRNFWRYYTDWFGSTTASTLLRTAADPTVYLVAGTAKYPITTFGLYQAFSPLGEASIVSQGYLDTIPTAHAATRIIRTSDGSIYFIDSAIKLQFTSCDQVVDYGGSCATTGYVNVTDSQAAAFHTGPYVTPVLGTQEGARYLLDDGKKREILDDASQAAAGLAAGFNVLTEGALANLLYGPAIVRDSVYVKSREGTDYSLLAAGLRYPVAASDVTGLGVAARSAGSLHAAAIAALPAAPNSFSGVVSAPGSSGVSVLTQGGRYGLAEAALAASAKPITVSDALASSYPQLGSIASGTFIKSTTQDDVYLVTPTELRPVAGWDSLQSLANNVNPTILSVPAEAVAPLAKGKYALGPGLMYRTAGDPQIYLIDGLLQRIPIGSFDYTDAAGFTKWSYTTQSTLDAYAVGSPSLTFAVKCGAANYISVGGRLRPVPTGSEGLFPFTYVQLADSTCARAQIGAPSIEFIRTPDGAIYLLRDGTKRHVSASTLTALNAGRGWMQVSTLFASRIPSGAAI